MGKSFVKTVAVVVALSSVLALAGCSKLGKKTTYYATEKDGKNSCISGAYIRLDKGWSVAKGTGYAEHAYNTGSLAGSTYVGWRITGSFKYSNNLVTMTSGKFNNMSFKPSFTLEDTKNATKIKLMGKIYKA